MNKTCYRHEPGCGHNDGQERVNDALEVATRNRRSVNPSEVEGSASLEHEVAASANQTDDAASGVEMDFSRVIVLDPGSQAWGYDSCSCSYLGTCLGCVVDAWGAGLRFVFDSSRGRVRNLAFDRRP